MTESPSLRPPIPVKIKKLCLRLLVGVGLTALLSLFCFSSLKTQYSLSQFLPKQNPLLARDIKTKQTFQMADSQPFIATLQILDEQQNWLEREKIQILKKTSEDLQALQGVKSALSLATVEGAINSREGLSVGPLLSSIPPEKWFSEIMKNSFLTPTLISKDMKTASLIVNIGDQSTGEIQHLKDQIESLLREHLPFAKVEIGGAPAVQSDISLLLRNEIRNFVILGFAACLAVLSVVFANFSPVFISFVITVTANLIILAAMTLFGFTFTVLSTTLPILATIVVMSLCIHSMLRFIEERKNHPSRPHYLLVLQTMKALLRANLLAIITPMIGFLSLATTQVPLIRDFGLTVALAILICWFVSYILLVPLLILLPPPQVRSWAWAKARWGLLLFRKSGFWAFLIIALSITLAIQGQNLSWTARLFDDLPQDHQVRSSTQLIDQKLGGMIPIDLELRGPSEIWNDPKLLEQLDQLIRSYRQYDGIGSAVGLPDLIAASNLSKTRLPTTKASTAEILFLYSLSDQSPLKNYLNADASHTRVALRARDLPADKLHSLIEELKLAAQKSFPQFSVQATGMGSTIHPLNNQLSKDLIYGFWQSMLVIFLLLITIFRSLRWALVACIPNLVPPAALLGFLAITQTPIKPSIAIIFSIALGLAFNNTVYFLDRLKSLQRGHSLRKLDVQKTLWLEGNPCLISSLTLLAGFSVFLVSHFSMNRTFGFYMVLSMVAGMIGDLILLPTLLKSCPWLLAARPPWSQSLKENPMVRLSAMLFVLILASLPGTALSALPPVTIQSITQELEKRLSARDEEFEVSMKIIEADQSSKTRNMKILRRSPSKSEHHILVRITTPKDLRGTSLLASFKNDKEDKWLYLPSSKQTRRLASSSQESSSILGSELNTEDFNFNTQADVPSNLQKEVEINQKKFYVVESDVGKTSTNYSKIVSYISADNFLPAKSEAFDKQGKLLKVIEFNSYKKFTDSKWRAENIRIKNVQNSRATEITLSKIMLNQNLPAEDFTPKSLREF